jgi:hypothetical protein
MATWQKMMTVIVQAKQVVYRPSPKPPWSAPISFTIQSEGGACSSPGLWAAAVAQMLAQSVEEAVHTVLHLKVLD